ncbi:MAG: nucleotide exchange factor GrpE [Acidimicrobiales bacterium]
MSDAAEGVEDPPEGPDDDIGSDEDAGSNAAVADEGGDATAVEGDVVKDGPGPAASVEELIADLERITGERDDYLDRLRRSQAEFENYRKRMVKQQADDAARATERLVDQLLPVLDACDGAMLHGATEVEPIFAALLGALEKQGLTRIDPSGAPFDPNLHDAVMHEAAAEGDDGTVVSAVMRPGYGWNGRVVRPAMVKVRG